MHPRPKSTEKGIPFDPRVTILALVVLSLTTVTADSWLVIGGVAALLGGYLYLARLHPGAVLASTRAVLWFVAAAMVVSMLSVPGNVLFSAGGAFVTTDGIMSGLMLSARLVLLVWISTAYVLTVPLVATMDGIDALLHPFARGRSNVLLVAGIAVAFVPMLISIARRVRAARIARGEPEGKGFIANVRFAGSAAIPLFATVFRSADDLAQAMEARCFDPAARRTGYSTLTLKRRDWFLAGALALLALISLLTALRPS